MAYIDPKMVKSPKGRVAQLEVLKDFGEGKYSVAKMLWDGKPAVGVRWNGGDSGDMFEGLGNPQSRGIATWFIMPGSIADIVMAGLDKLEPNA